MAQSFRRSLFPVVGLSSCLQKRSFTQVSPRWNLMRQQHAARPHTPSDRSIRSVSKEQATIPSDVGLLEETFITPTRSHFPSLFSSPTSLVKFQYYRIRLHLRDYFSLLYLKFGSPRKKGFFNRIVELQTKQIAPTAVALHRQMYAAFAEADIPTLRKLCIEGVFESFRARIATRPRGEKIVWELVKYNRSPKLVSNRGAKFPGMDGSAVRQAVVRISSRQRLTRYTAKGKEIEGTGKERDLVEYVVLQKRYLQWKEESWQVWGTATETVLSDVEEWKRKASE